MAKDPPTATYYFDLYRVFHEDTKTRAKKQNGFSFIQCNNKSFNRDHLYANVVYLWCQHSYHTTQFPIEVISKSK